MNSPSLEIKNNFLATGVGSLPHKEPKEALDSVFEVFKENIPFWPQLPKRSFYENMYVQFCEKLPGVKIDEQEKSIWVDTQSEAYLPELEECFNKYQSVDVDYFAISPSYAQGFYHLLDRLKNLQWQGWVKAQVIGPLSLGLSLLDENKNPILYNNELGDLLPLFLSFKASWIIRQLKILDPAKVIIFIDEPYLVAVGTSQCSLSRKAIIDKINQVVGVIHDNGAVAGLHCCGNTDWELVMATDIDILNFDAYGYFDKLLLYERALASFLKRGSMLALGIVPNNEDILKEGLSDELFEALKENKKILANGALITTSCGCSGMTEQLADKAHGLCAELAQRLRQEN